jgi:hypothetical protein
MKIDSPLVEAIHFRIESQSADVDLAPIRKNCEGDKRLESAAAGSGSQREMGSRGQLVFRWLRDGRASYARSGNARLGEWPEYGDRSLDVAVRFDGVAN